jgi:hypothetical protein
MPDSSSFRDAFSLALQSVVDKRIVPGEEILMSLAGATGEGLVVTDRRVMILREQMSLMGSVGEIDCFCYPYEQIHSIHLEDAVGGGHLKLDLLTIPSDEKHVTLFFPSYDVARFEAVAARIRLLVEQTRGGPAVVPTIPGEAPLAPICPRCGVAAQTADLFCSSCGHGVGKACIWCRTPMRQGASFCPRCGATAADFSELSCRLCDQPLNPEFLHCPACGAKQHPSCMNCGASILGGWQHCAFCGNATVPAGLNESEASGEARAEGLAPKLAEAEEHNDAGLKFYQEERYEEAVVEFEKALDCAPGTAKYHCNLGVALSELGRSEEATEEYETAIRLAPTDPTAYLYLGQLHAEDRNTEAARLIWERLLEIAPGSPEAMEAREGLASLDGTEFGGDGGTGDKESA